MSCCAQCTERGKKWLTWMISAKKTSTGCANSFEMQRVQRGRRPAIRSPQLQRFVEAEHWVGQALVPWHISMGTLLLVPGLLHRHPPPLSSEERRAGKEWVS